MEKFDQLTDNKNNLETLNGFVNTSLLGIAISNYKLSRSPSMLLDCTLIKLFSLNL